MEWQAGMASWNRKLESQAHSRSTYFNPLHHVSLRQDLPVVVAVSGAVAGYKGTKSVAFDWQSFAEVSPEVHFAGDYVDA